MPNYIVRPFTIAERLRAQAAVYEWESRQHVRFSYHDVEREYMFCCTLRDPQWSGNLTSHLKTMAHVGMLFHVSVAMMHDAQHRFGRIRIVS